MKLDRRELIASAQVSGLAEQCTDGGITLGEALEEIRDRLEPVEPDRRGVVLAHAAARYVKVEYGSNYHRLCAEVLAAAGADLDEARRVWLARFPSGSATPTHRI